VNLSAYTKNYVNPLAADLAHMNERGIRDVIADKSEFMLSLCDQLLGNALNQKHHSIIDRCIRELYMRAWKVKKVPVMTDFYHILKSQKEMEAQELALSLELFVEGSLNIFNHQTNVDVDNRFTVYGIQDLGSQLAPVAMLVMMEAIQQRIIDNGKRGRATWLYIDECHVLLNSDYSATYLQQLWKKVRKQGGLCTGITQNVVDLLQNYIAMTLLSNSEFVALLKQANVDSAKLAEVIGVSDAQLQYVHNSPSGTGLLKCGSVVIPFDNQISKDSDLYKLYNTNIHEKIAMGMVGEDSIFHGYHSDEMTEDFSEADDGTQDSVFTSDEWNGDSDLDEAPETDVKIYEPVRSKEKKEQDNCWMIYG
jgi:type IV secretory pathway VirB4 component